SRDRCRVYCNSPGVISAHSFCLKKTGGNGAVGKKYRESLIKAILVVNSFFKSSDHDTPSEILKAYKLPTLIIALGILLAVVGFQLALNYDINQSSRTFRELSDQVYRAADAEV